MPAGEMTVRFGGIPSVAVTPSTCGMLAVKLGAAAEFESEESLLVVCVPLDLVPNVKAVAALGLVGAAAEGILTTGIGGTIAVTETTVSKLAVATVEGLEADALAFVSFAGKVCFRRVSEVELALSASAVPACCCATPADPSLISVTGIDACVCPSTSDEATVSAGLDDEGMLSIEFAFHPSELDAGVAGLPLGVWLEGADPGSFVLFEFVAAAILDGLACERDTSDGSEAFGRG